MNGVQLKTTLGLLLLLRCIGSWVSPKQGYSLAREPQLTQSARFDRRTFITVNARLCLQHS